MSNQNPLISIIIPLYNKKSTIERCIYSALTQSYPFIEILVVDDGSTDGSGAIVLSIQDNRLRYLLKMNGGVSSARNYGICRAKGEWIIYIDADDYFLPNALEILLSLAKKYNVDIATGNFLTEFKGEKKSYLRRKNEGVIGNNFRSWFFQNACPRAGATLFRANIIKENLFDESLCRYEDAKSLFDIMRVNRIVYTPTYVMVYSKDNLGLSIRVDNFSHDFISCMNFSGKTFWEKIVLGSFISQGLVSYTDYKGEIKEMYSEYMKWRYYAFLFNSVNRFYSLCRKIKCFLYMYKSCD